MRILIVDDDEMFRELAKLFLTSVDDAIIVEEAETGAAGLAAIHDTGFDCVLLDYRLPDMDGLTFLDKLGKEQSATPIPVVMLTGSGDERVAVGAIKAGACDYLKKQDMSPESVIASIRTAIEENENRAASQRNLQNLERLALTDSLTLIGNRTLFDMRLDQALRRARRVSDAIAVLMIDLNGFKSINDVYGHLVGDKLLTVVAQRLAETVRDSDCVVRLGGDEFVLLMETGASVRGTSILASRIDMIIRQPVVIDDLSIVVRASVGVALFPDDGDEAEQLMQVADAAMYRAKRESYETAGGDLKAAARLSA